MQRFDGQGNVTGSQYDIFHSRWFIGGIAGAAAAAAAIMTATNASGALISPMSSSDVPVSNPASVFDTSNTGNTYSLGPGTALIPAGFDTRDLFGGSFGTFGAEQNDIIFDNYQPIGSVATVNVTLASPTALTGFNLYLEDDGTSGDRSASEFRLYGDGQLIDDILILDTSGQQSYTSIYGSNSIDLSDQFSNLSPFTDYTLQFVQNRPAGDSSGVRALEFQATGNPASVPEPASTAGMSIAAGVLLSRRRRRIQQ